MAQRIVNNEQYESLLIKGGEDGSTLAIRSNGSESFATFNRPGDTTPYSANDVINASGSTYITFSGLLNEGADVYITNVSLMMESNGVPAGMGAFRLHLYNQVPSGVADNLLFAMASGDASKYEGFVDLNAPVAVGSNYIYRRNETVNAQVSLASGQSSLFGVLQSLNGWTPVANTQVRMSIAYFPA